LIGYPASLQGEVRSSNHDRECDRRDGWVGPSSDLNRLRASLGWMGTSSTRAKWRALRSARSSTLKKCLTAPTLLERRFMANYRIHRTELTIFLVRIAALRKQSPQRVCLAEVSCLDQTEVVGLRIHARWLATSRSRQIVRPTPNAPSRN
jgi:hypothetical protein